MTEKALVWLGSSREDVRGFPQDARRLAGTELFRVQCGLEPTDWKPMPSDGGGVREIRIRTQSEHRVLYVARLSEAVYVLHAFQKRSRKTPRRDLELARWRLRVLESVRRRPRR